MANFGYIPDPVHARRLRSILPRFPKRLIQQVRKGQDVMLWKAKDTAEPDWVRHAQAIGDCVSWGGELVCTCLLWMMHVKGLIQFEAEAATEPIYGGCRVEVNGGRPPMGKTEDGASGSWCAEWLTRKGGILLRKDYSLITGNPEHDLRKYDGKESSDGSFESKARRWGYYGCGGKDDQGKLDVLATANPIKDGTPVTNADEAEAAIVHECPITIASGVGFEADRDSNGIILPRGSWGHQMCILGVKYMSDGTRLFRIFQSWGDSNSNSGPDPGIDDKKVTACSWWTTDDAVNRITGEEDSYAFSGVQGFTQQPYDFGTGLLV